MYIVITYLCKNGKSQSILVNLNTIGIVVINYYAPLLIGGA